MVVSEKKGSGLSEGLRSDDDGIYNADKAFMFPPPCPGLGVDVAVGDLRAAGAGQRSKRYFTRLTAR